MIKNNLPIGIFDSGVGGLTVWKEINKLLPNESTIYLADSLNAPYGQKSVDEIIHLSIKNTEYLLSLGVKTVVVACNTATTNAISELRNKFNIPIIGLEPAIKPAVQISKNKNIGVLATERTIMSSKFQELLQNYPEFNFVLQPGFNLVDLIENGKLYSPEMSVLVNKYVSSLKESNVDCIVLGCTHYPFLREQIHYISNDITIIDSGEAIAKRVAQILSINDLKSNHTNKEHYFYTNTNIEVMQSLIPQQYIAEHKDF